MQITLEFIQIIDLMALTTALILGVVFLFKSPKSNQYLGLFLLSLALEIMQVFGTTLSEINSFNIDIPIHTSLLTMVFLLFYVLHNISGSIQKRLWFLTFPAIVFNIVLLLLTFEDESIWLDLLEYAFNIGIIVYTFNLLKQHENNVVNYYSDLEQKTLWWIKSILYVFIGFHLLWITEDLVGLFNQELPEVFAMISTLATCVLVYWIGYKGIAQPEVFNHTLFKEKIPTEPILFVKDEVITNESDLEAFNILKEKIAKEKLYTNADLNLRSLAIDLGVKEKELSRIINTQTNFYQLINSFRVAEFKKLTQSPKATQLSLLGLAHEAGFSSKSSFYSVFKKLEGMTPKQYELSTK